MCSWSYFTDNSRLPTRESANQNFGDALGRGIDLERLRELLAEVESDEDTDFDNEDNGPGDVLEENLSDHENFSEHDTVMSMENRFPAMLVLWLGREFYKVKHEVTGNACSGIPDLATILATWREIWRPWRQIDDSRKCSPFLDISIRKGNTLEYMRKLHVTSRPVGESIKGPRLDQRE
ncbi:hypothetical protein AVEN_148168-1 [Araneus ventricosus]|uniref:Uncharacterized protein n=1 Tax=Araneus ventricosus TaxID=182803 RepID=A0A4Y2WFG5_ARAVE|nr:hypothetical protein AVEN_148168-1 [Araneus ventricosus]